MKHIFIVVLSLMMLSANAFAGDADVVAASVMGNGSIKSAGTSFQFSVTVRHADEGWDHYADAWEVVDEHGTLYGKRVLAHPHINEQPFTRPGRVTIPLGVTTVVVRAHDSVHGYGGLERQITLPGR